MEDTFFERLYLPVFVYLMQTSPSFFFFFSCFSFFFFVWDDKPHPKNTLICTYIIVILIQLYYMLWLEFQFGADADLWGCSQSGHVLISS